jgi:hypothetical protein
MDSLQIGVQCQKKTNKGLCDLCWFLDGPPQPESIQQILFDCPLCSPRPECSPRFSNRNQLTRGQTQCHQHEQGHFHSHLHRPHDLWKHNGGRCHLLGTSDPRCPLCCGRPRHNAFETWPQCYPGTARPTTVTVLRPKPDTQLQLRHHPLCTSSKSIHFLTDREQQRLNIMYHGRAPSSPSPLEKWEATWVESGAFHNTGTSRLTLQCRLPNRIEQMLGAFPFPRSFVADADGPNAPNPAAGPAGNGARGGHRHQ